MLYEEYIAEKKRRDGLYCVWRRSDGYVAATAGGSPAENGNHGTDPDGSPIAFVTLLSTYDWNEARDLIEKERANDPLAAGWWNLSTDDH